MGRIFSALLLASLASCSDSVGAELDPFTRHFSFAANPSGWTGGFADYPVGEEEFFELEATHTTLPAPLDTSRGAIKLRGSNRSDDLFMFLKHRLDRLQPDTEYEVHFEVEFATNAGSGCVGIGGAPGESVFVKAGAFATEPRPVPRSGFYEMNVDKGVQGNEAGDSVRIIGDVASGSEDCSDAAPYRLKTLRTTDPVRARTDPAGGLWLLVGTDSGFEGVTTLYYTSVAVELRPR